MHTHMMARWFFRGWVATAMMLWGMTAAAPVSAQSSNLPTKGALPAAPAKPAPAASTPPAAAAPAPAPAPPANAEADAKKLYDQGVKLEKTGQVDKAIEAFAASFALKESPATAASLGRLELKAGKYLEAVEHLRFVLAQAQGMSDAERQATEKQLAEAKTHVGMVTVRVNVEGADLLVDGNPIGQSPHAEPLFLEPGTWRFEAQKEGHTPSVQNVDIKPGASLEIDLNLTPAPAPAPVPASSGQALPETEPHPKKWLVYTGAGVSGALAIVALGTAAGATVNNSKSKKALTDAGGRDQCNASQECTDSYNDHQNQWASLATASVYTFIAAAVVGGGTAAYALLGDRLSRPAQVSVMVTPQGGALSVTGSF